MNYLVENIHPSSVLEQLLDDIRVSMIAGKQKRCESSLQSNNCMVLSVNSLLYSHFNQYLYLGGLVDNQGKFDSCRELDHLFQNRFGSISTAKVNWSLTFLVLIVGLILTVIK